MDPVEEQVEAFNARDLGRFIACYSPEVVVEDEEGRRLIEGHEAMRAAYGQAFAKANVHAEILNRIRVGPTVVDEERVSGLNADGSDLHAIVAYRLDGNKIGHVWFLTSAAPESES